MCDFVLRRAALGDLEQTVAEPSRVLPDVIEARQRGQALEPEDALEERRRLVANCAAGLASRLADQPPFEERRDRRVCRHTAYPRDLRTRAGPEIRHDRERL